MEKRYLENLGITTSLLGFGAMRLPLTPEGKIDELLAESMIDKAIAAGVNYIDTAYPYHNRESEPFVGRVLNKFEKDSYYLEQNCHCLLSIPWMMQHAFLKNNCKCLIRNILIFICFMVFLVKHLIKWSHWE